MPPKLGESKEVAGEFFYYSTKKQDFVTLEVFTKEHPNFNFPANAESLLIEPGPPTRLSKPVWWDDKVTNLMGEWESLATNSTNARTALNNAIDNMTSAGYKFNEDFTEWILAVEGDRQGRDFVGPDAKSNAIDAALENTKEIQKYNPDAPPYIAVKSGDNAYTVRQGPSLKSGPPSFPATDEGGISVEAQAAFDKLPDDIKATHTFKYDINTNEYVLTDTETYADNATLQKFLGADWVGEKDVTGRYVPVQMSIGTGAPNHSMMREMIMNSGGNPDDFEFYEDFNPGVASNQRIKIRATSTSTGKRYSSFKEAELTAPQGWEVQGYIFDGDQYYKHVRSAEEDPDENIKSFDDLILRTYMQEGPSAALKIDGFRDRVNQKAVTFMEAASLAGSFAKNAADFKTMIGILMQPPPGADMSAFDDAINNAGSGKFGTQGPTIDQAWIDNQEGLMDSIGGQTSWQAAEANRTYLATLTSVKPGDKVTTPSGQIFENISTAENAPDWRKYIDNRFDQQAGLYGSSADLMTDIEEENDEPLNIDLQEASSSQTDTGTGESAADAFSRLAFPKKYPSKIVKTTFA